METDFPMPQASLSAPLQQNGTQEPAGGKGAAEDEKFPTPCASPASSVFDSPSKGKDADRFPTPQASPASSLGAPSPHKSAAAPGTPDGGIDMEDDSMQHEAQTPGSQVSNVATPAPSTPATPTDFQTPIDARRHAQSPGTYSTASTPKTPSSIADYTPSRSLRGTPMSQRGTPGGATPGGSQRTPGGSQRKRLHRADLSSSSSKR
jgi:hypothetical protein